MYAYKADVLAQITRLPQSPLELAESLEQLRWIENGYKIKVGYSDCATIGIDTPDVVRQKTRECANRFNILKVKLAETMTRR